MERAYAQAEARRLATSFLVASALGLTACDRADDPPPPKVQARAVCELSDAAGITRLVGDGAVAQSYATPAGGAAGCTWQGPDGRTLTINLARGPRPGDGLRGMFERNRELLDDVGQTVEDEAGIGEAAYWQPEPGVLHALGGECYLTAHLRPTGAGTRASLRDLLSAALRQACPPEAAAQGSPAWSGFRPS